MRKNTAVKSFSPEHSLGYLHLKNELRQPTPTLGCKIMVKERPCYISPTPPKCQKVAVDLKLWLSAPEIPSSQHRVKQSSRGVKFQLTARSGLNLNFSSSLERVSAVQTLSACFATQFHADCQTLLPVGSSTCG